MYSTRSTARYTTTLAAGCDNDRNGSGDSVEDGEVQRFEEYAAAAY